MNVRHQTTWLALAMTLHGGCYTGASGGQGASDGAEGSGSGGADDGAGSDGSDGSDDGGDDGVFGCTQEGLSETIALRRLSKVQYANTVADLITWADADNAEVIQAQAQSEIDQLPDDLRVRSAQDFRGGMRRLDQAVHQEHINQSYEVGRVVGAAMTTPDRIAGLVGACATDADTANDEQCVDDFIAHFGERAHRRPLTDEELALYREVFDGDGATQGMEPIAFADVIQAMMGSPFFLYAVEHGEPDPEEDGSYRLSAYELASRLSYHFWQTMPDEALLASAASGELVTEQGYEAQVDRMLADPRTRAAVGEFYRDWLWLEDVPSVAALVGSPKYDGFLDGMTPNAETTQNMRDEVLRMALYYTFDVEGGLSDLLTSDRIFPVTDDLAAIYGVAPWDGQGEPPVAPEAERLGLLTRAGMLATGSSNSHPVLRGVFIRRALLCDPLPPPPADVDTTAPSGAAGSSTRQAVEALTEANAVCRGCHDSFNPLGFILEGFDAAGRLRTDERILHQDGSVIDTVPIDDTAVARVDGSDASEVSGAAELAVVLADSGRVEQCFARHYVRFTFAREESLQDDACMIEGLSALATDQPLSEMLRSVAFTAAFRQRTFEQ